MRDHTQNMRDHEQNMREEQQKQSLHITKGTCHRVVWEIAILKDWQAMHIPIEQWRAIIIVPTVTIDSLLANLNL